MATDLGPVHVLVEPGGECVTNCPHPDHRMRKVTEEWWLCGTCKYSMTAVPLAPAPFCPRCGGADDEQ